MAKFLSLLEVMTFTGADGPSRSIGPSEPGNPGLSRRNPNRKDLVGNGAAGRKRQDVGGLLHQ